MEQEQEEGAEWDVTAKECFIAIFLVGVLLVIVGLYMLCSPGWATFISGALVGVIGFFGFMLATPI